MTNRIVLILSLVLGVITAGLIFGYLETTKKTLDTTTYVEIIVAKEAINPKTTITNNHIEKKKIPSIYKHAREITDAREIVGRVALVSINAGQSIMDNQIVKLGESKEGLSYKIPEGKRAFSVAIDDVIGVAGLIKVGDRVDITTNISIGDVKSIPYTLVVLQDIEVLAVGKNIEDGNTNFEGKTITLAVTLEESLPLKTASQRGSISLLLRSPVDDSQSNPKPFTLEDFLLD